MREIPEAQETVSTVGVCVGGAVVCVVGLVGAVGAVGAVGGCRVVSVYSGVFSGVDVEGVFSALSVFCVVCVFNLTLS
jgi:nitrate/nitrite transporter NarK